jgi:hypothetical protein
MPDKSVSVTSLQLVGAPLSEAELLNAGRLIEARHQNGTGPRHRSALREAWPLAWEIAPANH